jgi:hypothetical protein
VHIFDLLSSGFLILLVFSTLKSLSYYGNELDGREKDKSFRVYEPYSRHF